MSTTDGKLFAKVYVLSDPYLRSRRGANGIENQRTEHTHR